jgi:hypothetical protein
MLNQHQFPGQNDSAEVPAQPKTRHFRPYYITFRTPLWNSRMNEEWFGLVHGDNVTAFSHMHGLMHTFQFEQIQGHSTRIPRSRYLEELNVLLEDAPKRLLWYVRIAPWNDLSKVIGYRFAMSNPYTTDLYPIWGYLLKEPPIARCIAEAKARGISQKQLQRRLAAIGITYPHPPLPTIGLDPAAKIRAYSWLLSLLSYLFSHISHLT